MGRLINEQGPKPIAETPPAAPPATPLPLWRLLGLSVTDIVINLQSLVVLTAPWIALDWIFYLLMAGMFGLDEAHGITTTILGIVVASVISVAWHRHILLDEPLPRFAPMNRRIFRYCFFYGVFCLVWFLATTVLTSLGTSVSLVVWPIGIIVMFTMAARLAMLFPGVAVDHHGMSFVHAWKITQGCSWRLVVGQMALVSIVLVPTLIVVAISPINANDLAGRASLDPGISLLLLGYLIIYHVIILLDTAFLSFAYLHIASHQRFSVQQEA